MSPLTGVLREAWQLYKTHAAHFLAISFPVYVAVAVVGGLLTDFAGAGGDLVAIVVNLFGVSLVEAALVIAVRDVRDGRVDLDLRATVSAALPFVLPVAGASILFAVGVTIGFVLLIVPGLVLVTFWSLVVPAIVVGRAPVLESFRHSWRTVRGYGWQTFGTYVAVFCLWVVFDLVLTLVLGALPGFARSFVSQVVAGALVAPFLALVVTLVYDRLAAAHRGQPTSGDNVTV